VRPSGGLHPIRFSSSRGMRGGDLVVVSIGFNPLPDLLLSFLVSSEQKILY